MNSKNVLLYFVWTIVGFFISRSIHDWIFEFPQWFLIFATLPLVYLGISAIKLGKVGYTTRGIIFLVLWIVLNIIVIFFYNT